MLKLMTQTRQFALVLQSDLIQSCIINHQYFVKTNNI